MSTQSADTGVESMNAIDSVHIDSSIDKWFNKVNDLVHGHTQTIKNTTNNRVIKSKINSSNVQQKLGIPQSTNNKNNAKQLDTVPSKLVKQPATAAPLTPPHKPMLQQLIHPFSHSVTTTIDTDTTTQPPPVQPMTTQSNHESLLHKITHPFTHKNKPATPSVQPGTMKVNGYAFQPIADSKPIPLIKPINTTSSNVLSPLQPAGTHDDIESSINDIEPRQLSVQPTPPHNTTTAAAPITTDNTQLMKPPPIKHESLLHRVFHGFGKPVNKSAAVANNTAATSIPDSNTISTSNTTVTSSQPANTPSSTVLSLPEIDMNSTLAFNVVSPTTPSNDVQTHIDSTSIQHNEDAEVYDIHTDSIDDNELNELLTNINEPVPRAAATVTNTTSLPILHDDITEQIVDHDDDTDNFDHQANDVTQIPVSTTASVVNSSLITPTQPESIQPPISNKVLAPVLSTVSTTTGQQQPAESSPVQPHPTQSTTSPFTPTEPTPVQPATQPKQPTTPIKSTIAADTLSAQQVPVPIPGTSPLPQLQSSLSPKLKRPSQFTLHDNISCNSIIQQQDDIDQHINDAEPVSDDELDALMSYVQQRQTQRQSRNNTRPSTAIKQSSNTTLNKPLSAAHSKPSMCQICENEAAVVECDTCDLVLCTVNECDHDIHINNNHIRHSIAPHNKNTNQLSATQQIHSHTIHDTEDVWLSGCRSATLPLHHPLQSSDTELNQYTTPYYNDADDTISVSDSTTKYHTRYIDPIPGLNASHTRVRLCAANVVAETEQLLYNLTNKHNHALIEPTHRASYNNNNTVKPPDRSCSSRRHRHKHGHPSRTQTFGSTLDLSGAQNNCNPGGLAKFMHTHLFNTPQIQYTG